MGPNRQNWTFPLAGTELVARLLFLEEKLAAEIDVHLDDEALYERDLAEFREQMRKAGVLGWDRMQLPDERRKYDGTRARSHYSAVAKRLQEIQRYRRALERELERDPTRSFKLTYDDVVFFDL